MTDPSQDALSERNTVYAPGMQKQLDAVCRYYDQPVERPFFSKGYQQLLRHYLGRIIPGNASIFEVGCGSGELLESLTDGDKAGVDLSAEQVRLAKERLPESDIRVGQGEECVLKRTYDFILLSDVLNEAGDVQQILENMHQAASPDTRLVVNFHNTLWRPILAASTLLGLRHKKPRSNWLSNADVANLLHVSGWEVVREEADSLPSSLVWVGLVHKRPFQPFPFVVLPGHLCRGPSGQPARED